MGLPNLVYDDFYKFVTSFTVLSFILSIYALYQQIAKSTVPGVTEKEVEFLMIFFYIFLVFAIISVGLFIWAILKWKKNQNLHDRKLKAETIISEQTAQRPLKPEEGIYYKRTKDAKDKTALVTYKIASVLPNTVHYNFVKDWKVWFWIGNHETKKYRAYVKVKFITKDFEKEAPEGYYGGTKAWNLNALSGIQAPGLDIPKEIRAAAKQKQKIEIKLYCTVKDENDKLVEKKLPQGYVYGYNINNWYLEP